MLVPRHGGRGRAVVLATVLVAGIGLMGSRAVAAPPSPPEPAPHCTLSDGERGVCVAVDAHLDRAPALGDTAQLTIRVTSQIEVPAATLQALLPANLSWTMPPAGFAVSRRASSTPESGGTVEATTATLPLHRNKPVKVTGTVRATATGPTTVSVQVTGPAAHPEDSATTTVVATVATAGKDSYLGFRPGPSASTLQPPGTVVRPATPGLRPKLLKPTGLARPQPAPSGTISPAVIACATGSWTYQDQTGASHPQVNIQVQLMATAFFGNDLLAVGLTDQNGAYRLCAPNASHRNIFVQEVTENGKWTVQNGSGGDYVVTTPTVNNVGNGSTTDFGSRFPSNSQFMRAMHAYDEANDASAWTPGDCWSPNDHDCKVLHIRWTPNSTDGTFYQPDEDTVHLKAADPDARSVVVHELGHGVMDNAYHDNFPASEPSCRTHFINKASGPVCGWTEGFADWFQASVYNDPEFNFGGGVSTDLEGPTWGTPGFDNGDTVEGRIAGAMIDLVDSHNEPFWDRHSEANPGPLMQTLFNHRATTFAQFWSQRAGDHFDVGPDALAALYQNTIDYQFQTTTVFWSVVAVRPPAGTDYDLFIYDDQAQTNLVGASLLGAGVVDFVAVDSNRRPLGAYYPRVLAVSGSKEYQIELAQGASLLQPSEQITMGTNDVVTVRDVCLAAGDKVTLTATPSDPSQNGELFVMADDPATPATWVQPRSNAAAASPAHNPGQPATLTFTAPNAACYGVVLDNTAGNGTYTLTRS